MLIKFVSLTFLLAFVGVAGYLGLFFEQSPDIRDSKPTSNFNADTWGGGIHLGAYPDKMRRMSRKCFNETNLNFYGRIPFANKSQLEQVLKELEAEVDVSRCGEIFKYSPDWFVDEKSCKTYSALDLQ